MKKKKKTALWRLQKEGCPDSFLFGTMHLQDARAYSFIELAENALQKTQCLYTEVSFQDLSNELMIKSQKFPKGQDLSTLLGEKKFKKVRKILLKVYQTDIEPLKEFLPMILVNQLVAKKLNKDQKHSLDLYLHLRARELGLNTKGIESITEHLSVLKNVPMKEHKKQMLDFCKKPEKLLKLANKLADLYSQGELMELYKLSKKSMGKLRKPMIYDRNALMTKRMIENIETPSFYAIGAGHLAGKKGIIRLLKLKDVRCEPVLNF